ncbi:MAG: hypothetical protein KGQ41_07635, partial [Alphaproteobacteria bacterium]|nr:hypothetical protein [Alphaproteobacteria bacterium]
MTDIAELALALKPQSTRDAIEKLLEDVKPLKAEIALLTGGKVARGFMDMILSADFSEKAKPQIPASFHTFMADIVALPEVEADFMGDAAWGAMMHKSSLQRFAQPGRHPNIVAIPSLLECMESGLRIMATESDTDVAFRHFYYHAGKLSNAAISLEVRKRPLDAHTAEIYRKMDEADPKAAAERAEMQAEADKRDHSTVVISKAALMQLFPYLGEKHIKIMNYMLKNQERRVDKICNTDAEFEAACAELDAKLAPFMDGTRNIGTLIGQLMTKDMAEIADAAGYLV